MLTLASPTYRIDDITIYRDHADSRLFYYAAPAPRLAESGGRIMFDLFTYRNALEHSVVSGTEIPSELGAGFLTMGVACPLTSSDRRKSVRALSEQAEIPEESIILQAIPYNQGSARLIALDHTEGAAGDSPPPGLKDRPTFVERVIGSGSPSLLGNLEAIFSLTLSRQGVTFLESVYRDGAAPVGIVYDLEFYGLNPAVDVSIHADQSRIYRHFGGGLSGQYQWLKADIGGEIEKLQQEGAVDIEVTSQATGEDAQKSKELALDLFKEQIVQEMFRPTAPAPPQNIASHLGGLLSDAASNGISLTLKAKKSEELKRVTYSFSERAPRALTHSPQGFLPILLEPEAFQRRIHAVDLRNDFFRTLRILITGPSKEEFEALGIRQVTATVTYPADGSTGDSRGAVREPQSQTVLFRPDSSGDKTIAFGRGQAPTMAYAYQLTYDFERAANTDADALHYELPQTVQTSRAVRVNPRQDFGVLEVEVEPGRIHADVEEVDVLLAYVSPDARFSAGERFRFTLDQPGAPPTPKTWQVRTRGADTQSYSATCTYFFRDGDIYPAPSTKHSDPLLRIDSPFVAERRLLIRPNATSEQTTAITVEIEYRDEQSGYERGFTCDLTPPFDSREISWPILDANRLRIRYRVTVAEPGFLTKGDWVETSDTSILVGGPVSRRATVQIRLIGATLADAGLDALLLKVEPTFGPHDGADVKSNLFTSGHDTATVTLRIPPGESLRYRYQTTAFKIDGQVRESSWIESESTLLVISTRTV